MKIVSVQWEDACSCSGYYDRDHPEKFNTLLCVTVGHLVRNTHKDIVLASELFEDKDTRHIHTIPKGMVRKVVVLEEIKEKKR